MATLLNNTLPSTRMSAGGAAAVCATASRALPGATELRSLLNAVNWGGPPASARECTTTSVLDPAATLMLDEAITFEPSRSSTLCAPAARVNGPTRVFTLAVGQTFLPSTNTSKTCPTKPWMTKT